MHSKAAATLSLCAALALPLLHTPRLSAASFTQATVTRLQNDVRVLKENAAPRTAGVGDHVDAVSSVATGPDSRVELQFPDKSLTRLGANSRFTVRGDQRTLDLDQGVMFLQVPKQMGGAKIRTGAVTAAVTGITTIFEYLQLKNGGVKIIVIEGEVQFYRNDKPGEFRTIKAGEMLLMDFSNPNIPATKKVDLKQMLKTGNAFFMGMEGTPNANQVNDAVAQQQNLIASGVLKNLDLVIPGRGNIANAVNRSSQTAHTAQLVHAINSTQGAGGQNQINLLSPTNDGSTGGGVGNNGKAKGKGNGLALALGKDKDKNKGNAFGKTNGNNGNKNGNSNGQGPGNSNSNSNKPKKK